MGISLKTLHCGCYKGWTMVIFFWCAWIAWCNVSSTPQDMFEKVNKAYEFLCTKSARITHGPDPENIILILKAQSILFNRHRQGPSSFSQHFLALFPSVIFVTLPVRLVSPICRIRFPQLRSLFPSLWPCSGFCPSQTRIPPGPSR